MLVPVLNGPDSHHQAPLADLAEWLSQNLQEDLQGDAMVSSPTHPSRWGPLAPAGIVESKTLFSECLYFLLSGDGVKSLSQHTKGSNRILRKLAVSMLHSV